MNHKGARSPLRARFDNGSSNWTGLHGSSTALALLSAARAHDGTVLVVTRSSHQSHVLEQDVSLFSDGTLPVLHFPDHETLPYDPFSPHPDIIAERLSTLSALAGLNSGLLFVPIATLMQRLPPRSHALGRNIQLKTGQSLVIENFRQRLQQAGYNHSDPVYQSGQFAIRGSVIDLFPTGRKRPLRIDLFDEEIDSLREFDPEVEFILNELFENEIKFYRSLISIREGITRMASRRDIEALIKEDLVLKSHPRESKKYHEAFQNKNFELGFHELRKFLELWLSSKEIVHEFYLLNVMRHLKSIAALYGV